MTSSFNLPIQKITVTPPLSIPTISDGGTTDTLIRVTDLPPGHVTTTKGGHRVHFPNGDHITSIDSTVLHLPAAVGTVQKQLLLHIYQDTDLHTSLSSVSELTNQGCAVIYTSDSCTVLQDTTAITEFLKHNAQNILLKGSKESTAKLWSLPLPVMASI